MAKPTSKRGRGRPVGSTKEKETVASAPAGKPAGKHVAERANGIVADGDFQVKMLKDEALELIIPTIDYTQDNWEVPKQGTSDYVCKLNARGQKFVAFITICRKEAGYKER
jgi:hypothetical protein